MASEFDYEWNSATDRERVRKTINNLKDQALRMLWTSGDGGVIERDLSEIGLERWKVRCYSIKGLEEVEAFLREALGPLADHEIKMHPVYQDAGSSLVGWLFWHRKES